MSAITQSLTEDGQSYSGVSVKLLSFPPKNPQRTESQSLVGVLDHILSGLENLRVFSEDTHVFSSNNIISRDLVHA